MDGWFFLKVSQWLFWAFFPSDDDLWVADGSLIVSRLESARRSGPSPASLGAARSNRTHPSVVVILAVVDLVGVPRLERGLRADGHLFRTRANPFERNPGTCGRGVGFRRLEPGSNALNAGASPAEGKGRACRETSRRASEVATRPRPRGLGIFSAGGK